jgi:hypothetical protein
MDTGSHRRYHEFRNPPLEDESGRQYMPARDYTHSSASVRWLVDVRIPYTTTGAAIQERGCPLEFATAGSSVFLFLRGASDKNRAPVAHVRVDDAHSDTRATSSGAAVLVPLSVHDDYRVHAALSGAPPSRATGTRPRVCRPPARRGTAVHTQRHKGSGGARRKAHMSK